MTKVQVYGKSEIVTILIKSNEHPLCIVILCQQQSLTFEPIIEILTRPAAYNTNFNSYFLVTRRYGPCGSAAS